MSPEQAQGAKDLDGRSDVYVLGTLTYQMLSGRLPYKGDTPIEVMLKHIQEPPPDLQATRPDLPPATAEVVRRAMTKNREARYPTVGAFVEALEAALREGRSLPPEAATVRATPATKRPRRRWWIWALPLLLLLLAGGALRAWWLFGGGVFALPAPTVTSRLPGRPLWPCPRSRRPPRPLPSPPPCRRRPRPPPPPSHRPLRPRPSRGRWSSAAPTCWPSSPQTTISI
ncbi:MAG TPA: hypothetical protein EYH28_02470 [Anaerolineaceae bacterium]|nr:hypothetical protein [Anaerolineaceae bacterium]